MSQLSNADSSSRHPSNKFPKITSHSEAITQTLSRRTDTLTRQQLGKEQGRAWWLTSKVTLRSWRAVAMAGLPVLHWQEILILFIFSKEQWFKTLLLTRLPGMVLLPTHTQIESSPSLKAFTHRGNRHPHILLLTRTGRLSDPSLHLKRCSRIKRALRKWSWSTQMGSSKYCLTILCKVRNTKTIRIRKVNRFSRYRTKIHPLLLTCHVSTVKVIKSGVILSVSSQIKWTRNYPSNPTLNHSRRHLLLSSLLPARPRDK